jgi:hypothetical protein
VTVFGDVGVVGVRGTFVEELEKKIDFMEKPNRIVTTVYCSLCISK